MEEIISKQNKHWQNQPYEDLHERLITKSLLEKLSLKSIQILAGVRRCGKSSIFRIIINELMRSIDPRQILYVNLDDPFYSKACKDSKELYTIVETAEKLTGMKIQYLFLDEIQNVDKWEKFVKSVYDNGTFKKIYITGSNAKLLNDEYISRLSGRYLVDFIYPLTFAEKLKWSNIGTDRINLLNNKPKILKIFDESLQFGFFPELLTIKNPDHKRETLISYYDTILLKDCIICNEIRDISAFKELASYLLSNVSSLYSYKKLAEIINSSDKTIKQFISSLVDGYLLNEISNFSYSRQKQIKSKKKSYAVDTGLANSIAFSFSANKGQLFENLILMELYKNGFRDVWYYAGDKECDFIVQTGTDFYGIQVCYETNKNNMKREIDGLKNAVAKLKLTSGYIITYDQEKHISDKITMLPFWKINCQDMF